MSERKIRVDELIKREISMVLHCDYQQESVAITITKVDTDPNLKNARVYYSVIGDRVQKSKADKFLNSIKVPLSHKVFKKVIFKYTPKLSFVADLSVEKSMHIWQQMDLIEEEEEGNFEY